jgi:hypothetical protein
MHSLLGWGVLGLGGIRWVYVIEPQRHRAHGGRTTEDYYYPGGNWAFQVGGVVIKKSARFCPLAICLDSRKSCASL